MKYLVVIFCLLTVLCYPQDNKKQLINNTVILNNSISAGGDVPVEIDPNSLPYKYYRFDFLAWDDPTHQLAEIQLYDVLTGLPQNSWQGSATAGLAMNNSSTTSLTSDNTSGIARIQDNQFWTGWDAAGTYLKIIFTNVPDDPVLAYGICGGFSTVRWCSQWKLYGSQDDNVYVLLDERTVHADGDNEWYIFTVGE